MFVGVELIFKTCWMIVTPTLGSEINPNSNFTLSSLFIVNKFKEIMPSLLQYLFQSDSPDLDLASRLSDTKYQTGNFPAIILIC